MVLFILRESASAFVGHGGGNWFDPEGTPPSASNGPSELLEQGTGVVTRKARREELIFFAIVANHVMLNACFMTAGQNTRKSACPMGGVDVECKKGSCGPRGATMVKF